MLEKVRINFPKLFEEETNDTKEFFDNEIKPANLILEYKPYKEINRLLITESLENIKRFFEYIPMLTKILETKDIFQIKEEDIPLEIKKLTEKMQKDTNKINNLVSETNSDLGFVVRILLEQIRNFDSFNFNLIKFLIRLKILFKSGKRNYNKRFTIKSEFLKRDNLKNALLDDFFNEFADLRRFLLNYLEQFKRLRNICSHRTPKYTFSHRNKYALIYNPNNKDKIKVHIERTKRFVLTYVYFIEALNLYR